MDAHSSFNTSQIGFLIEFYNAEYNSFLKQNQLQRTVFDRYNLIKTITHPHDSFTKLHIDGNHRNEAVDAYRALSPNEDTPFFAKEVKQILANCLDAAKVRVDIIAAPEVKRPLGDCFETWTLPAL